MSDKVWVVETARCWGTGRTAEQAVIEMAGRWHGNLPDESNHDDPVTMAVWHVAGYSGGQMWDVDADEVLEEDFYDVDRDLFSELVREVRKSDLVLIVEEVVVESPPSERIVPADRR